VDDVWRGIPSGYEDTRIRRGRHNGAFGNAALHPTRWPEGSRDQALSTSRAICKWQPVAADQEDVKRRAKESLLVGAETVHKDDLLDIDDCLAITEVAGLHVHLAPVSDSPQLVPNNGYHIIPKPVVQAYAAKHGLAL